MKKESIEGAVIVFKDGKRAGEVIAIRTVSDPKRSKPEGAEFYIPLASIRVGTVGKNIKHGFVGTYGGEIRRVVLYGKYI